MSKKNSNPKADLAAGIIIIAALTLAIFSVRDDSVTTDESPHITAGYSYLTQRDMRLNPEHPPLIKDLAALPLLFQKINFDAEHPAWKKDVNGQWAFGPHFLFESGNNPDAIAWGARLAVMVIFILLGLLVYKWAKENREWTQIEGLSYRLENHGLASYSQSHRKDGDIIHNRVSQSPVNLDNLTDFPFHLFKSDRYDLGFVFSSRGCPHRCIFCSNRVTTGKKYRYASAEKIMHDLDWVYNQYLIKKEGKRNIQFLDDNLLVN